MGSTSVFRFCWNLCLHVFYFQFPQHTVRYGIMHAINLRSAGVLFSARTVWMLVYGSVLTTHVQDILSWQIFRCWLFITISLYRVKRVTEISFLCGYTHFFVTGSSKTAAPLLSLWIFVIGAWIMPDSSEVPDICKMTEDKVLHVLSVALRHTKEWGNGGMTPCIFIIRTLRKWIVSYTLRPPDPRYNLSLPLWQEWVGLRACLNSVTEKNIGNC